MASSICPAISHALARRAIRWGHIPLLLRWHGKRSNRCAGAISPPPHRHFRPLPSRERLSQRTPERETLLGRDRNQLVCALIQGHVVSDERKQPGARRQAASQRRRMSQPPSLSDCCVALCQCLVGKAETEKDNSQERRALIRGGELRPDGQASRERSYRKVQAPLRDATGMTQTCRQTAGSDRRIGDRERARPSRCADGSDAANPRPGAAPNRIRRGYT